MPAKPPRHPSADGPETSTIWTFQARRRLGLRISEIGERQHGIVTLDQLRRVGLSPSAVRSRVEEGSLYRVHEGVYAIGQPPMTREAQLMAAVLACGEGAVLSHRSAAALWQLRKDVDGSIDVTAPNRRGRFPRGIAAHRDGTLTAADCTVLHEIPCTSLARTLLDLAAVVPMWALRKAVSEAEVLRLLDFEAMRRLIKRSRGRRGVARLRLILEELDPATKRTRSELERLFLAMCVKASLPRPEVNVSLDVVNGTLEPDFLWRDAGLIVEADSRRFHDTYSAFQHDRLREQRLQLAGWRVSRCTWEQVEREPWRLAETIRGLLVQQNPRRRA